MPTVVPHTKIETVHARAYRIPTDGPEADGTLAWDSTTMVLVRMEADGVTGIGYSYSHEAAAVLIRQALAPHLIGRDALAVPAAWQGMIDAVRNLGRAGICASAIAAVDAALWDLKARLLGVPLADLIGRETNSAAVYGSGGFTSYDDDQLIAQMRGWRDAGITRVKMKIGADVADNQRRIRLVREALGDDVALMVDANGAFDRKEALAQAEALPDFGVDWFEEPVSSDDLDGLRLLRDRAPAGVEITAGEYGYDLYYFLRMLQSGAVDVLQADVTRCAGITGFLRVAALAQAHNVPLSAHTAPALHLHPCCTLPGLRHIEYFHDHVRIERRLFDGVTLPRDGRLEVDRTRPGLGLELREDIAAGYAVRLASDD